MEAWVGQWWHRAISRAADRSHPQAAVDLAKSATLVEFPGVGHAPFLEDRDRYLSELTGFLRA